MILEESKKYISSEAKYVFKLRGMPKDRQMLLAGKTTCNTNMKKETQEQDDGNLFNSFDLSFKRPWQHLHKLPDQMLILVGLNDYTERLLTINHDTA